MGYPQICHFGIPVIGIQLAAAVLRWTSLEEIAQVQGQRNPSKMVGAGMAVRRYPTSKGKGEVPARQ